MRSLTTAITGGQWFLPVLVLIFLNIAIYQYASKKQLTNLMKFLRWLEYVVFLAILILIWIIYAKGRTTLVAASFISTIIVECIGNQLLDSRRRSLQEHFGKKYPWIRFGFDLLIIVALGIICLTEYKFNLVAWIIITVIVVIVALIDFAWSKYK